MVNPNLDFLNRYIFLEVVSIRLFHLLQFFPCFALQNVVKPKKLHFAVFSLFCYNFFMTAEQFKKRRIKLGLTKAKLAELLDVQEYTIWRWEAEKVKISRTVELAFERIEQKIKEQIS